MATAATRPSRRSAVRPRAVARRPRVARRSREARGFARGDALDRARRSRSVFVLLAIFAPLISPYGFDQYEAHGGPVRPARAIRRARTCCGTTVQSTDVLSRIDLRGAQTELEVVGHRARVRRSSIGVPLGLFSGYFGGPLDRVLVLFMDAMFAFPSLLLAIVIAFLLSDTASAAACSPPPSRSRSRTSRSTSASSATT